VINSAARFLSLVLLAAPAIAFASDPAVTVRRVPDGGLEPRAAIDSRGTLHLIYFKGDPRHGDVFYVRSTDAGVHFSKPLRVNNEAESALIIGGVRGPQIAIGKNDHVHVAWTGSDRAMPRSPIAGPPMLYTRTNDASDAFEPQRNLMTRTGHLDGGGSIAADDTGNVYVAWHGSADKKDDSESARRVWLAHSADDGKTFAPETSPETSPETPTDAPPLGACACCALQVFLAPDHRPQVLFRSAREMVHRDMVLVSFDAALAHADAMKLSEWQIGKCVMSTADAAGGMLAWESNNEILLTLLSSKTPPQPIRGKNPKHPSIARSNAGETLVAWTENTAWNQGGSLKWQRFGADAKPIAESAGEKTDLPTWDYPAAVALPGGGFVIFY
jgi:hypothetical protein